MGKLAVALQTMLILIAVLAFASAAFLLFRYARRQSLSVSNTNLNSFEPPRGARPLFEPSAADIARETAEQEAKEIARREYRASAELNSKIDAALSEWRLSPNSQTTAQLLNVTTESTRSADFERAAEEVIKIFRESGIAGLSSADLAGLLDSHYRLLPTPARSSGALFWLKQEVAKLSSENL